MKTPYDKRDIVSRLAAFLRRPETLASAIALLDGLDARILGMSLLRGPAPETALRSLFEGELPLFDLGLRISNLFDRLLLFRFESRGRRLTAVCPIVVEAVAGAVLEPTLLFGAVGEDAPSPGAAVDAPGDRCAGAGRTDPAMTATALFAVLAHAPGAIRKGGGLTKRATDRVRAILPEPLRGGEGGVDRMDLLVRSFGAAGLVPRDGDARMPDAAAFATLVEAEGGRLVLGLAAALRRDVSRAGEAKRAGEASRGRDPAGGRVEGVAREGCGALAAAREAAILGALVDAAPRGLRFSRAGLVRWLRLGSGRIEESGADGVAEAARDLAADAPGVVDALEGLGIARRLDAAGWTLELAVLPAPPVPTGDALSDTVFAGLPGGERRSVLVAEGSHALHLLPEAGLSDRAFIGRLAAPVAFGAAWSWELDRESLRRAFAGGLDAASILARLGALAGRPLPQSLAFSIRAWEEEYRSLRLYRGLVLAVDERLRAVVESSRALAPLVAERLGPGLWLLAAGEAEAAEALREAGLEPPPETRAHRHAPEGASPQGAAGAFGGATLRAGAAVPDRASLEAALAPVARLVPAAAPRAFHPEERRDALRAAAVSLEVAAMAGEGPALTREGAAATHESAAATRDSVAKDERRREMADRVERGLVLTERQMELAELRPERNEAAGLDYLGKARLVERALRSPGDRLEVLMRLPGADPVRALLRPVRLDKTEKGLVLEAEDLATGAPIRLPLGAASAVRRLRASLFGEDR